MIRIICQEEFSGHIGCMRDFKSYKCAHLSQCKNCGKTVMFTDADNDRMKQAGEAMDAKWGTKLMFLGANMQCCDKPSYWPLDLQWITVEGESEIPLIEMHEAEIAV